MKKVFIASALLWVFTACQNEEKKVSDSEPKKTISEQVSALNKTLNTNIQDSYVLNLDHHKMAKEEGVYTPPSIATIFSDPKINTELIKLNPLIGIDLPFKVLCYTEPDTSSVSVAFTSARFIAKRHGLEESDLGNYESQLIKTLQCLPSEKVSPTKLDSVGLGYGIISIQSEFDFTQTVNNLRAIVEAQNDTRWFGEIDFQKDAKALEIDINPATLLLFGGPAPGGKAMMTTPKIGLDAFCQKVLVYEQNKGEVMIAFNDIITFSELYYGLSTKPQTMINQRLKKTFSKAVKE